MKTCNKTIPTIVEGNSLYEAVCVIKDVAEKAIAEAETTATAAEAAKAAAEAAQQTANQAHEEATNAAASAEQAGEKAQAAQTAADGAQTTANEARTTANRAESENSQQNIRIHSIEDGTTVIPIYFKTTRQGNAIPGMNGAGTGAVYYWATGTISGDLPLRRHGQSGISDGALLVPQTPTAANEATSKHYVDTAVADVAAAPDTSLTGQTVLADENGAAISQITVQRIGISGFSGTLKKISYLDITGEIATNYRENTSKKLSFDITGVLGDGGNPGVIDGKIPVNVFSGEKARFTLAEFNASAGKLVIDCSAFDPTGGNIWKVFSQHAYYKS